jgi:predicted nucleic acid-binding Zn ribbon protein
MKEISDFEVSQESSPPEFIQGIRKIFFLLIIVHFVFNFAVLPGLNIVYAFEVGIIIFHLMYRGWKESAILIIALLFLEGQGRIIWSYHPFFRLIFDITLLLAFFRKAIRDKRIFPVDLLPNYMLLLIILHFLWYAVQLFNTDNVGLVGVLAAAKIYIVPFFIFFLFLMEPVNDRRRLEKIQFMVIFMLIAQSSLAIFQMISKEDALLGLHPYYARPLKGEQFSGSFFRPFGTGFNAGGFSVFYYLTIGLVFLTPTKGWGNFMRGVTILTGSVALFISQVRSAMVKFLLIFIMIQFIIWVSGKNRFKSGIKYLLIVFTLFFFTLPYLTTLDFVALDLQNSVERLTSLTDVDRLKGSRIGLDSFFRVLSDKLDQNPIGLGPGRTGAASTFSMDIIMKDPLYGKFSGWAYDNLWISLAIDMGWGAIFYMLIIMIFPVKLFFYAMLKRKELDSIAFRIILISSISLFVIILGNWGAVALPYNPESFMFWFWVSIGWSEYHKGKKV